MSARSIALILGKLALSPRSEAKKQQRHYLARDRYYGWLCVLCGKSGRYEEVLESKCFAFPDFKEAQAVETPPKPSREEHKQPAFVDQAKTDAETAQQLNLAELAELEEQEALLAQLLELQEVEQSLLVQEQEQQAKAEEEDVAKAMRLSRQEAWDKEASSDAGHGSSSSAAHSWEPMPGKTRQQPESRDG